MSRIATLATVLTMVVAPAALARPIHPVDLRAVQSVDQAPPVQIDLRSPDSVDRATPAQVDLRTPDAQVPVTSPAPTIDLRSPDAVTPVVLAAPHPASSGGGFDWGILGIVLAALAACGVLAVMLRSHFQVGRPLGA